GYDPERIDRIQVPNRNDPEVINELLRNPIDDPDDPGLAPDYETRWLAVFDRSNIRRPTDRPRLLLLVELPVN
ncbi:MAG: hypothetical protein VYC34_04020, partial [Planctomycetota bacterium]|nr:hypothetical protein [Planctomycetota bacterium]